MVKALHSGTGQWSRTDLESGHCGNSLTLALVFAPLVPALLTFLLTKFRNNIQRCIAVRRASSTLPYSIVFPIKTSIILTHNIYTITTDRNNKTLFCTYSINTFEKCFLFVLNKNANATLSSLLQFSMNWMNRCKIFGSEICQNLCYWAFHLCLPGWLINLAGETYQDTD